MGDALEAGYGRRECKLHYAPSFQLETGGPPMAIKVGDKIPSLKLKTMKDGKMSDITTDEIFRGKKVVLFAVPGAFTPTCSMQHLPGFVEKAGQIRAKGVDTIACISVNDAF